MPENDCRRRIRLNIQKYYIVKSSLLLLFLVVACSLIVITNWNHRRTVDAASDDMEMKDPPSLGGTSAVKDVNTSVPPRAPQSSDKNEDNMYPTSNRGTSKIDESAEVSDEGFSVTAGSDFGRGKLTEGSKTNADSSTLDKGLIGSTAEITNDHSSSTERSVESIVDSATKITNVDPVVSKKSSSTRGATLFTARMTQLGEDVTTPKSNKGDETAKTESVEAAETEDDDYAAEWDKDIIHDQTLLRGKKKKKAGKK